MSLNPRADAAAASDRDPNAGLIARLAELERRLDARAKPIGFTYAENLPEQNYDSAVDIGFASANLTLTLNVAAPGHFIEFFASWEARVTERTNLGFAGTLSLILIDFPDFSVSGYVFGQSIAPNYPTPGTYQANAVDGEVHDGTPIGRSRVYPASVGLHTLDVNVATGDASTARLRNLRLWARVV